MKGLKIFLIFYFLLFLENYLTFQFSFLNIAPDLILVGLVVLMVNDENLIAIIMAFIFGYLQDSFSISPFGLNSFIKILVVISNYPLLKIIYPESEIFLSIALASSLLTQELLFYLIIKLTIGSDVAFPIGGWLNLFERYLVMFLVAIIILKVFNKIFYRKNL